MALYNFLSTGPNDHEAKCAYDSWRTGLRRQLLRVTELTGLIKKKQLDSRILLQNQRPDIPKLKTKQLKSEHTYICKNCNNLNGQRTAQYQWLGSLLPISFWSTTWPRSITVWLSWESTSGDCLVQFWLRAGSPTEHIAQGHVQSSFE